MATAHIYFLRIDSLVPGEDHLRLCNCLPNPFPQGTDWGQYKAVGTALHFEEIQSSVGLESNVLKVSAGLTDAEVVRYCSNPANVQENDACVHHSIGTADNIEDDFSLWVWGEPRIEFLGRLGQMEINSTGISASIYSASSDLSSVTNTATKWSDGQHRRLLHPDDYGFRYANSFSEQVNIITT